MTLDPISPLVSSRGDFFAREGQIYFVTISHSSTAQAVLFLLSKARLTLSCEVGGKGCDVPPVAEKANTWFGVAVGFLQEYEQKKTGTARGSVTRLTIELV